MTTCKQMVPQNLIIQVLTLTQCDAKLIEQETIQSNNEMRATTQSNSDSNTSGSPSNSNINQNNLASQNPPQEATSTNQVRGADIAP